MELIPYCISKGTYTSEFDYLATILPRIGADRMTNRWNLLRQVREAGARLNSVRSAFEKGESTEESVGVAEWIMNNALDVTEAMGHIGPMATAGQLELVADNEAARSGPIEPGADLKKAA